MSFDGETLNLFEVYLNLGVSCAISKQSILELILTSISHSNLYLPFTSELVFKSIGVFYLLYPLHYNVTGTLATYTRSDFISPFIIKWTKSS